VGGLLQAPIRRPNRCWLFWRAIPTRVAISNRRLIACDEKGVHSVEDYRAEGRERYKVMTLATDEFIAASSFTCCRSFHRIRYYGLLASPSVLPTSREHANCSQCVLPIDALNAAGLIPTSRKQPSIPALLRRLHDHHREVRTRRNSALPTEPATPSDQDRHIMICPPIAMPQYRFILLARAAQRAIHGRAPNQRARSSLVHSQMGHHNASPGCFSPTQSLPLFPSRRHRCGTRALKPHS